MTTTDDWERERRERVTASAELTSWAWGQCAHAMRKAQREPSVEEIVRQVQHANMLAWEAVTLAQVLTRQALKENGGR